jgi:hypothetical protein
VGEASTARVTVGVDGAVTALRAVGRATAGASACGMPLRIVHARPAHAAGSDADVAPR